MQGKIFSIIHFDPDRESSTSLIDAAFIKLTSDNDVLLLRWDKCTEMGQMHRDGGEVESTMRDKLT